MHCFRSKAKIFRRIYSLLRWDENARLNVYEHTKAILHYRAVAFALVLNAYIRTNQIHSFARYAMAEESQFQYSL